MASVSLAARSNGEHIPSGWKVVVVACEEIERRLDDVVERIVTRIFHEIPAYRRNRLDAAAVAAHTRPNVELVLRATAERRGPRSEEIATRRTLGRLRASAGLPAEALIQAFQIGINEVWRELTAVVLATSDRDAITALLKWIPNSLSWVQEITSAIVADHREAVLAQRSRTITAAYQLLVLLQSTSSPGAEARELAAKLGFEHEDRFRAWCLLDVPDAESTALHLGPALAQVHGTHVAVCRHTTILVLTQDAAVGAIDLVLHQAAPNCPRGRGIERAGLRGARLSLFDARQAAQVARPGGLSAYEDVWLETLVLDAHDQVAPVLEPYLQIAQANPALAAAVASFIEGHSAAAAGRALDLHPNTVSYRLDRWTQLTGSDPRLGEDVVASFVASRLAGVKR